MVKRSCQGWYAKNGSISVGSLDPASGTQMIRGAVNLIPGWTQGNTIGVMMDFDERQIHYFIDDQHVHSFQMPFNITTLWASMTWGSCDLEVHLINRKENYPVPSTQTQSGNWLIKGSAWWNPLPCLGEIEGPLCSLQVHHFLAHCNHCCNFKNHPHGVFNTTNWIDGVRVRDLINILPLGPAPNILRIKKNLVSQN